MKYFFVFIKKSIVLYQHTILMHWLHHTVLCVIGIYGEVFLVLIQRKSTKHFLYANHRGHRVVIINSSLWRYTYGYIFIPMVW